MIPNLFKKLLIPKEIPKELSLKIKEFSRGKNKEKFLKKSFLYIVSKYRGNRFNLIFRFDKLFKNNLNYIVNNKGYMHCTTMNFLLRVMAVKSGLFNERDVRLRLANTWYIAQHQYLEVKLGKKKIALDPWN